MSLQIKGNGSFFLNHSLFGMHMSRTASHITASIAKEFGLDNAFMLAGLEVEFEMVSAKNLLICLNDLNYAKINLGLYLEFMNLWTPEKGLEIVKKLVEAELIDMPIVTLGETLFRIK